MGDIGLILRESKRVKGGTMGSQSIRTGEALWFFYANPHLPEIYNNIQ